METRQPEAIAGAFRPMPINLKQWIDEVGLVHLSLEAVQALDPADTQGRGTAGSGEFPAPMMLTLLTYCFSVGLFGSNDIERSIASEPAIRYLCANRFPDANQIRSFRRRNTPQLKACLCSLFKAVWSKQHRSPGFGPLSSFASKSDCSGSPDPAQWEQELSIEAELRLKMAMLIDSMDLDE